MDRALSEADRAFLAAAAEDIQRRLSGVAVVHSIGSLAGDENDVELVVILRAGRRQLEYRGRGEGLADAYRALLAAAMHGPHAPSPSADSDAASPPRSDAVPGALPVDVPGEGRDGEYRNTRATRVPAAT